jgi:hypothetical protein
MYPWQKSISTVSFMMGSRPAWCTATPRRIKSRSRMICKQQQQQQQQQQENHR